MIPAGKAVHARSSNQAPQRLRRMQYRPGLLEGFLAKTRLDLMTLQ